MHQIIEDAQYREVHVREISVKAPITGDSITFMRALRGRYHEESDGGHISCLFVTCGSSRVSYIIQHRGSLRLLACVKREHKYEQ